MSLLFITIKELILNKKYFTYNKISKRHNSALLLLKKNKVLSLNCYMIVFSMILKCQDFKELDNTNLNFKGFDTFKKSLISSGYKKATVYRAIDEIKKLSIFRFDGNTVYLNNVDSWNVPDDIRMELSDIPNDNYLTILKRHTEIFDVLRCNGISNRIIFILVQLLLEFREHTNKSNDKHIYIDCRELSSRLGIRCNSLRETLNDQLISSMFGFNDTKLRFVDNIKEWYVSSDVKRQCREIENRYSGK